MEDFWSLLEQVVDKESYREVRYTLHSISLFCETMLSGSWRKVVDRLTCAMMARFL